MSRLMPAAIAALVLVGCSPGLHFRRVAVLGTSPDRETQSSRVSVSFEVWDGDEQLTNISRESFQVYEDGRPATSESLSEAGSAERRVPVVLLLDTSLSMYQANAVGALKQAAWRFVDVLTANGFDVTTYKFASNVEPAAGTEAIPETFHESQGRWTSLYAAVHKGMVENPDAIIVVFSDGADTYSQNHGINGLGAIEGYVLPRQSGGSGDKRVIHTIGFGNVASERDRQGIPGVQALERLARNGSFHFAQQPGALDVVFQDVADRIRNVYIFDYLSPNLTGQHQLVIEVQARGQVARTEPLVFEGGGSGAAATRGPSGMPAGMSAEQAQAMEATLARLEGIPAEVQTACGSGDAEACGQIFDAMAELMAQMPPAGIAVGLQEPQLQLLFQRACQAGRQAACEMLGRAGIPTAPGTAATSDTPGEMPAGGIGAEVRAGPEGMIVIGLMPGGGAEAAGITRGDVILSVDGTPLGGVPLVQAVASLRGEVGTTARLQVKRLASGAVEEVGVERVAVSAETTGE